MQLALIRVIGSYEQHYLLILIITDCYVRTTYLRIERIHLWTRRITASPRIPIAC
jgi:hypothetical protein